MRAYKFIFITIYLCCCSPNQKQDEKEAGESQPDSLIKERQTSSPISATPFTFEGIDSTHLGFDEFLNLFAQAGISETRVPGFIVKKFIDHENSQMPGRFNLIELSSTDSVHLIFYTKFVPVGPGVDQVWVMAYSKAGEKLADLKLGESYPYSDPGSEGKDYDYWYNEDKQQIEVINTTITWDEGTQAEARSQSNHYYKLTDDQFTELPSRMYQEATDRLLTDEELSYYSKEDMKLMRNEIYAAHGYIFKSESLKSYFMNQPWYKAIYDNVDDMLSDIEKANITHIKKAESNR